MGFIAGYLRGGRRTARPVRGPSPSPRHVSPKSAGKPATSKKRRREPPSIQFGYYFNRKTQPTIGAAVRLGAALRFFGERCIVLFGLNGAGKQTRILTQLYMQWWGSLFIFDVKGTGAIQTFDERAKFSDAYIVCPFPVLGLEKRSTPFNPIARWKSDDKGLQAKCLALATAIFSDKPGEGNNAEHFYTSGLSLYAAGIWLEVIDARAEGRIPNLYNVRMALCGPDIWKAEEENKKKDRLVAGFKFTCTRMVDSGIPELANLAARFLRENGKDELAGIQSTVDTQTRIFLDPYIAESTSGQGLDIAQLGEKRTTIYCVLPPDKLEEYQPWTRALLSCAINEHFKPNKMEMMFVLDEFRATVGGLKVVRNNWALVREFKMKFLAVLQSATQLETLMGKEWQNLLAQSGVIATLGPCNDDLTAEHLAKRCGETTIAQVSLNTGTSYQSGTGTGSGDSFTPGGISNSSNLNTNSGTGGSGGYSIQQVRVPVMLPQHLMELKPGEGYIWVPGLGPRYIPFYAPNYFQLNAPWAQRVKPNPLYEAGE
jgi:type IV secretory pathway TraG/TraD family ATPase VirD4